MALSPVEHLFIFFLIIFWASLACCQATARNLDEAAAATTTMSLRHERWMARHGRTYKTDSEKMRRFQIFKNNVEFIENFNLAGNRTYKLGLNKFTDLTTEEFTTYYTGYKAPNGMSETSFKYENVSAAEVPQSVDWRSKGAVTPVKNQENCGCCWAFSAVAAMEGIHQIKTGELVSLSEQEILDCDGIANGCDGSSIQQAFDYVQQNGVTTQSDYPYMAAEGICSTEKTTTASATITGYEMVPANNEVALQSVVANQPVAVAVDPAALHMYGSGIINGDCGLSLTHAITAVGYGTSEVSGLKYWIFKNSWGSEWGENGFVRMQKDIDAPEGMCGISMQAFYPTA